MYKNDVRQGFTLAEMIIVLTVLGIVAMVTLPGLLTNEVESGNRATMRKAIAAYEKTIETMRISQDLKGIGTAQDGNNTLNGYANNDGKCTNARKYFKITKEDTVNNNPCHFMTPEGVWWDVTTMSKPIVAFDKKGNPTYLTEDKVAEKKTNLAFYMVATEKQGAFIANDTDESDSKKILVYTNLWDGKKVRNGSINECTGTGCCLSQFSGKACLEKTDLSCQDISYGWTAVAGSYSHRSSDCSGKYRIYREDGNYHEVELYNDGGAIITGSYYVVSNGYLTKGINAGHPMMNDAKWDADGNLVWFSSNGFGSCSKGSCSLTPSPFDFDACQNGQSCWYNSEAQEWQVGWQEPNWSSHEANEFYQDEVAKLVWDNYQNYLESH